MLTDTTVPLAILGPILFTLMGPIAAIPLFAGATASADIALQRRIALAAYCTALIGLAVAVFIGASALAGWGVSPSSLVIAAGIILTLTALGGIFGVASAAPARQPAMPTVATGFSPIAIPGLVSPMAVAILVIFVSYFPSMSDKLAVFALAAGVMTINLGGMLIAHWFMRVVGPAPLVVLGAIFGVLQVAMGIEMIVSGITRSALMN